MNEVYNIYCDESSHIEKSSNPYMVLGAIWCRMEASRQIAEEIRGIKTGHGLHSGFEFKWTKVSPAKVDFYLALVDYFFQNSQLHFRALVADKRILQHEEFNQTHDDWYYKMYFDMLKVIINPAAQYHIYVDIKDTQGSRKIRKLHEVLSNKNFDYRHEIIQKVQIVRSYEIEQIQLTDLFIGAVAYVNQGYDTSHAKKAVVDRIKELSGYRLNKTTWLGEEKVNILIWDPKFGRNRY